MTETVTFKRGDTWSLVFDYGAVDLTGCTARLQVRNKRDDTLYLSADNTDGLTMAANSITLRFEAADTAEVPLGTHECDLELTFPDGTVTSTDTLLVKAVEDITK